MNADSLGLGVLKRTLATLAVLLVAAVVATYLRYQSLSPCDWMEQDLAAQSRLPLVVVRSHIRLSFLVDGIVTPGPLDCLIKWWTLRSEGLPPAP